MIINKKQRDVKFIIYQSLYILVIAMLGAKHVPINNIPDPISDSDTIVSKKAYIGLLARPDLNPRQIVVDTAKLIVLPKIEFVYMPIDTSKFVVITKDDYVELRKKIGKTEDPVSGKVETKEEPKDQPQETPGKKTETKKEEDVPK